MIMGSARDHLEAIAFSNSWPTVPTGGSPIRLTVCIRINYHIIRPLGDSAGGEDPDGIRPKTTNIEAILFSLSVSAHAKRERSRRTVVRQGDETSGGLGEVDGMEYAVGIRGVKIPAAAVL